jgi:hypothetical protein
MAVVTTNSDLYPTKPLASTAPDPAKARGRVVVATFAIANLSTDSSGSKYKLATIPADALLDESTILKVSDWGFATVNIGTVSDVDALVTILKSAGDYVSPVVVGDAKHGLPAWQALGMAAAPANNQIDLYAHAPANATGAGTLKGKIVYRHH